MLIGTRFSAGVRQFIVRASFVLTLGIAFGGALAGQPVDYFASAYGLSGEALKTQLRSIISTGTSSLSYTPGIWDAHKSLYEDPNDSSRLILFYSQASWAKSAQDPGSGSEQYWNREHLWANSYGIDGSGPAYTDLFHLVPANKYVNNDRSNNYFDYADPTKPNYEDPANSIAPQCKENGNLTWEPGDGQKGWVARAMLFMTTRYSHLELVDTVPNLSTSENKMAQLSVMLEWNRKFLPAEKEQYVNQRIYDDYQRNRNPYIDFPEFADVVWVGAPSWGSWRMEYFSLEELLDISISGDMADPDGDEMNNLLEMALYSDPRIAEPNPPITGTVTASTLTLSFARANDSSNLNLQLVLESSTDFESWNPVPLEEASVTAISSERESVEIVVNLEDGNPRIYRLRANRL